MIPPLPSHAKKVWCVGLGSLGAVIVGVALSIYAGSNDRTFLLPFSCGLIFAGYFGGQYMNRLVLHAKCPKCGRVMQHAVDQETKELIGRFYCPKCGAKWSTEATIQMHSEVDS